MELCTALRFSLFSSITSKTLAAPRSKTCLWRSGTMWTSPVTKQEQQATPLMTLSLWIRPPDALNPVAHPNRYLSYGFSNASAPGYIGLRVLDAYVGDNAGDPAAKIAFAAHKRITISTDPTTDAEMYALISTPGVEPLPANYDDQRFIQSYGPVESLAPGESFNIIMAVAIGEGLAGLQASSDWAQKLYDDAYVAPPPPPSPLVTAYPVDKQVTLVWDSEERWVDGGANKSIEEYSVLTPNTSINRSIGKVPAVWQLMSAPYTIPVGGVYASGG